MPREWETIQKKLRLEGLRTSQQPGAAGATGGADADNACTDIRFDGLGELRIMDDDLGAEETQLKVLGQLYLGCETLFYHRVGGELSRARILYVQGLDAHGAWQDPTICKLAPKDLLHAEADAHAAFARYIGESVPQRIGEPVYVDEVGGMVLELVGACWRMPELAHTQATLSNTFADVCKCVAQTVHPPRPPSALPLPTLRRPPLLLLTPPSPPRQIRLRPRRRARGAQHGARPPRLRRGAARGRRGAPRPALRRWVPSDCF